MHHDIRWQVKKFRSRAARPPLGPMLCATARASHIRNAYHWLNAGLYQPLKHALLTRPELVTVITRPPRLDLLTNQFILAVSARPHTNRKQRTLQADHAYKKICKLGVPNKA